MGRQPVEGVINVVVVAREFEHAEVDSGATIIDIDSKASFHSLTRGSESESITRLMPAIQTGDLA
jgi:hypothetical protein